MGPTILKCKIDLHFKKEDGQGFHTLPWKSEGPRTKICRGSSVVERRTENPCVESSILSLGNLANLVRGRLKILPRIELCSGAGPCLESSILSPGNLGLIVPHLKFLFSKHVDVKISGEGRLAQLVRASVLHTGGLRFES